MIWWTLQQLKSADPAIRIKAARDLGSAKSRKAVPGLVKSPQDENPSVRLAVIEALGAIGHPVSAEPLVSTLSRPTADKSGSGGSAQPGSNARGRILRI